MTRFLSIALGASLCLTDRESSSLLQVKRDVPSREKQF
jgi:hypothetical protein